MTILIVKDVAVSFGGVKAIEDVSFSMEYGEVLSIVGPNGAGKTTSFYMITGMVRVTSGNIMLNETDLTKMSMDKRARLGLGYLAQEPSIFTDLSVEDNLKLVLEFSNLDKSQQADKLETLLNDFSINHIRKSIAKHLSVGERRWTDIARALILNPDFILLPECFLFLSNKSKISLDMHHFSIEYFKEFSKINKLHLLLGSLPITENDKLYNRSILINPDGEILSIYDKIHMFDIILKNGESYKESDFYTSGSELKMTTVLGQSIGHSICYDLRYPKLYRALAKKGAGIIVIPSAFTYTTGKAHWHSLIKARAIENGVFILAPNQWGVNNENRSTYGHSLIVDPWGEILAEADDSEMIITSEHNLKKEQDTHNAKPL